MIKHIAHVGVTVSSLDRSVAFYRDVLGLEFKGEMLMEGPSAERLFGKKGVKARVAYLNGGDHIMCPPVELIQFTTHEAEKEGADLFRTSISEICFATDDIYGVYKKLLAEGVEFLSEPEEFDSTAYGFGKSIAVYFKDPDNLIMELIQPL